MQLAMAVHLLECHQRHSLTAGCKYENDGRMVTFPLTGSPHATQHARASSQCSASCRPMVANERLLPNVVPSTGVPQHMA
jgi:hypothetical protein